MRRRLRRIERMDWEESQESGGIGDEEDSRVGVYHIMEKTTRTIRRRGEMETEGAELM